MADIIGQVTIPASGFASLASGFPQKNTGGPGNLKARQSVGHFVFQHLWVQNNNASGNIRLGDTTVTTTRGYLIAPSTQVPIGPLCSYTTQLGDWYVAGTPGAIVDYIVVK
jgi:hypothetical protein